MFKNRVNISFSFYVLIFVSIFFDILDLFLYSIIFVFFHELAHILVAKFFGIHCKKINITPIGQIAILENLDILSKYKKILIAFAGIFLNLIFIIIFSFFSSEKAILFKQINLAIAIFNLLPIYPLDGGRILQYFLGGKIGDLNSIKIVKKVSMIFCILIIILGFAQLIFFPYNISLLCLGIYFLKINKNEYIKFTFEFYKSLFMKSTTDYNFKTIKNFSVSKNTLNKDVFFYLSQDYISIIHIYNKGNFLYKISEKDFLNYIENTGLNGKISDVYSYYLK